jgi:DNA-binding MarR family transcriptional regulator
MASSTKAVFALSQSPSHLLHRAQQLAADRFSALAGEKGVTLRQFAVLAAIAEQPGRSQTDLVGATGIDRSTLADMITRMEKRGWIIRVTSQSDARANAVTLAASGRAALTTCVPFARAADDAVLDALPRQDRKSLMDLLGALSTAADAALAQSATRAKSARKTAAAARPPKAKRGGRKKARRGASAR